LPFATRHRWIAATLALGLWAGSPALAATQNAPVSAKVSKPLLISWLRDLDLGTITLGPGSWSNAPVTLSRAGVRTCGGVNLTCAGAANSAEYNVQGSNGQVVRISAPNVVMTNQADPTKTLTLVTDAPASVTLTNSGAPGVNFQIGGTVTLDSTTPAGTYSGTFNVTVDY
jgi:spore coat protein U-like protein